MKRSLPLSLVALLALPAPAGAADRYPQLETATSGYTVSDGERYVAWIHAPSVRVLDDETGKLASYPLPPDCSRLSTLGARRVAAVCGTSFRLMNVKSGAWTTIPVTPEATALFNGSSVGLSGVGRHWLAVSTSDPRAGDVKSVVWINRTTGKVTTDRGNLRQYPNLDAAGLWRRLCAPLTRRRSPYDSGPRFLGPRMVGRAGLERDGDTILLRRCGTKAARVLTRSGLAVSEWFRGTRVTWIEQTGSLLFRDKKCDDGCIRTYDLTKDRFRTFTNTLFAQEVVHTRRHIFFDDDSDITEDVTLRYRIDLAGNG